MEIEVGALRDRKPKKKFPTKGNYTFVIEPIMLWGIERLSYTECDEIE